MASGPRNNRPAERVSWEAKPVGADMNRAAALMSCAFLAMSLSSGAVAAEPGARAARAPEFTHAAATDWINSAPLKLADFSGRVLFIDVWAFECWNCFHSFPWVKSLEAKFGEHGLAVLGVHSPELPDERVRVNVIAKVKEFGLQHPVMLDNDYSYWNALDNHYWPAFYVIDKQGRVRGIFVGETHVDDPQAQKVEALIAKLIAE
jgi:thiol-disulfide isomerase/thioredoxin